MASSRKRQPGVELIVFVMDGSGSMTGTDTYDGRQKIDHLYDIVKAVTSRLSEDDLHSSYRISYLYFAEETIIEDHGGDIYFQVEEALNHLRKATDVAGFGVTSIADALAKASETVDRFEADTRLPTPKHVTIFLFTDGREVIKTRADVEEEARRLTSRTNPPVSLATISFGLDADENLLKEIASRPKDVQLRLLELADVISQLPDTNKLYIQGLAEGELTEMKAEAIRNFLEILEAD